jgi:DNA transposition AAA+ family ATPase
MEVQMSELLTVKPVFVKTKNVRNLEVLMEGLSLSDGEGRMAMVYGRAGRGKTRTAQWYAAHQGCVFLRCRNVWRSSELGFLRTLCHELGVKAIPKRKDPCFQAALDVLLADPVPVFVEELEKLPNFFLELVRDLSDLSSAPFVIIGEEELVPYMRRNRRVWSRTFQQLEFLPIEIADVIMYVNEAGGLQISAEIAKILHDSSGGDFRIVRRDLINLVHIANSKSTREITKEMARIAVKTGLNG